MEFPPPPPRPPGGVGGRAGASAALRRQALMGAHRSGGTHGAPLPEEEGDCADEQQQQQQQRRRRLAHVEAGGGAGGSVEIRPWQDYWNDRNVVEIPGRGSFPVYTAGDKGAVVFCIHGGGYTGLTWSLVAQQLKDRYRVVAPDLRGHGGSSTADDLDFSAETMTADVVAIWKALFAAGDAPERRTPTLLVGHSMGGALAARAAAGGEVGGLEGVVVVDVVEGTAIAALPHMGAVLRARPQRFASPQAAAEWAVRSGTCKRRDAAGVSFPSQVVPAGGTESGDGGGADGAEQQQQQQWRWRTPLEASEPFWEGWYSGLSALFLALPVPKMLLLAGTDRLDKELTIGQMQGRFQLVLMPKAGHAVHEDEPEAAAAHLAAFLHRFRVGEPPMQIPRAAGARPVLPIVAGPLHAAPPGGGSGGAGGAGGSGGGAGGGGAA